MTRKHLFHKQQKPAVSCETEGEFSFLNTTISSILKHVPPGQFPRFFESGLEYIVQHCLDIEGIFREAGSVEIVSDLKQRLLNGDDIDFCKDEEKTPLNCLVVADILKVFFRSLTDPLIPEAQFTELIAALDYENDHPTFLTHVRDILSRLDKGHYAFLSNLLFALSQVAFNHHSNKMSSENCGLVWGPNIMWLQAKDINTDDPMAMLSVMGDSAKSKLIVTALIDNYSDLFNEQETLLSKGSGARFLRSEKSIYAFFLKKKVGFEKSVHCICNIILEDGKELCWLGDSKGILYLIDPFTLQTLERVDTGTGIVLNIHTLENNFFVTTGQQLVVRDGKTGEPVFELPNYLCDSLLFDTATRTLWVGSDAVLDSFVFDKSGILEKKNHIPIDNEQRRAFLLSLAKSDDYIYSGDSNGFIRKHMLDGSILLQKKCHLSKISCLIDVYGHIWSAGEDDTISLWDADLELIAVLKDPTMGHVFHLFQLGAVVLSCSWDGTIRVWDLNTFKLLDVLPLRHRDSISRIFFLAREDTFISTSWDRSISLWNFNTSLSREGKDDVLNAVLRDESTAKRRVLGTKSDTKDGAKSNEATPISMLLVTANLGNNSPFSDTRISSLIKRFEKMGIHNSDDLLDATDETWKAFEMSFPHQFYKDLRDNIVHSQSDTVPPVAPPTDPNVQFPKRKRTHQRIKKGQMPSFTL